MGVRKVTKYVVLSITILTAYLIEELLTQQVESYYKGHTYLSVAISMLIIVVVFIPVLSIVEHYIQKASKKYIQSAKTMANNSWKGLFVAAFLAIGVLYVVFAKVEYNIDVLHDVKQFLGH